MHSSIRKFWIEKTLKFPYKAMHYEQVYCTPKFVGRTVTVTPPIITPLRHKSEAETNSSRNWPSYLQLRFRIRTSSHWRGCDPATKLHRGLLISPFSYCVAVLAHPEIDKSISLRHYFRHLTHFTSMLSCGSHLAASEVTEACSLSIFLGYVSHNAPGSDPSPLGPSRACQTEALIPVLDRDWPQWWSLFPGRGRTVGRTLIP